MAILSEAPVVQRNQIATAASQGFAWRKLPGFHWLEALTLTLFFTLSSYAVHYHEHWDDEAQAWLIARDNTVWQILRYRLHYEGAPPVWHLLLHLLHTLGVTYTGIGWVGISLATAGMYVWLRWSPFPAVLRFSVPFTFFIQYQYSVIARSYVLFPLLAFTLCTLYTRKRLVMWFAIAAGLLANLSLHGFMLALTLLALYAFDEYRYRARDVDRAPQRRKQLRRSALTFAAMAVVSIYCAIPAPDLNFAIGDQVSTGTVHRILVALIGETPRNAARPEPEPPITDVKYAPEPTVYWSKQPRAWLAELVYPRQQHADHPALRRIGSNIGPPLLEFADETTWPIANSNLLACIFCFVAILWLRRRRRLRMLLPWLMLMTIGQILWTAEHHAGMLLIALLVGFWLAETTQPAAAATPQVEIAFVALLALIALNQIGWSASSIRADVRHSYDPGTETAHWLQAHPKPRMAAFGFATVSIQPWFPKSPFIDVPTSYWQWSSNVEVDGIHRQIISSHPDVVVYGLEFETNGQMRDQWLPLTRVSEEEETLLPRDLIVRDLHKHGYTETHRFCGTRFARFNSAYRVCDIIFEPSR